MTNEEKRKYIKKSFEATLKIPGIDYIEELKNFIPSTLYKYRKFDEYAFDMIENEYLYLAPAENLDDPFDCLTTVDMEKVINNDAKTLTDDTIEFIIEMILNSAHLDLKYKNNMLETVRNSMVEGVINRDILFIELDKYKSIDNESKNIIYDTLSNFQVAVNSIGDIKGTKEFLIHLISPKKHVGVCSLTTKRDNKPMWSLYADVYKGLCIEYDITIDYDMICNLKPIIYAKDFDNNIVKIFLQIIVGIIIYNVCKKKELNIGAYAELFCNKDSDWEYQDEWRIVKDAKQKIKMKIKNIYLGFDVSKENEDKVLKLSGDKDYGVYKMNHPRNSRNIAYTKLK